MENVLDVFQVVTFFSSHSHWGDLSWLFIVRNCWGVLEVKTHKTLYLTKTGSPECLSLLVVHIQPPAICQNYRLSVSSCLRLQWFQLQVSRSWLWLSMFICESLILESFRYIKKYNYNVIILVRNFSENFNGYKYNFLISQGDYIVNQNWNLFSKIIKKILNNHRSNKFLATIHKRKNTMPYE